LKNNGYFNISGFIISGGNNTKRMPVDLLNATGAGTEGFPLGHYYFDPPLKPGGISEAVFNGTDIVVIQIQPFILDVEGNKIICEQIVIKQNVKKAFDIFSFPGLVSLWKFDETSGTATSDSFGSNTGTLNNMEDVDWVTGKSGNALEFDGVDDYVDCGNDNSLNVDYITAMLWFKVDGFTGNAGFFAKGDNGNRQYWAWIYDANISLEIDEGPNYNYLYSLQTDLWYHLTITYNGSNINTYINGTEVDNTPQSTGTILIDDDPLIIGKLPGFGHFNGTIDEVMIFNTALTQQDIIDIYDSYR